MAAGIRSQGGMGRITLTVRRQALQQGKADVFGRSTDSADAAMGM